MNTNHKLAALIACVAAACLLAACGSASSSSSSSASAAASAGTGAAAGRSKLVACLKQHGVTLPSRPGGFRRPNPRSSGSGTAPAGGPRGGGFFGGGFGGGGFGARFRNNPKLQAAFKACGANFPAGRGRFNFANRRVAVDNFVKCVRQHGYDLPTPNLSGSGPVFPRTIESSKKFEAAARSCASLLAPRGGPPPGGQTTTASSTA